MALSNTAVPKYYGMFRDAVLRGEFRVFFPKLRVWFQNKWKKAAYG